MPKMENATAPTIPALGEADQLVMELLMTPEGRKDPYPRYHRLRQLAPVHQSQLGMWILTRYEDCAALLEDPRLTKDYARQNDSRIGPHWRDHVSLTDGERSMVNLDGPAHSRLRRLLTKAFTRRTIDALRLKIAATVDRLLAPLVQAGGGEVLEMVAFPLALSVIGEMLGVPESDRGQFPRLVRDLLVVFETRPSPEQLAVADQAQLQFRGYFQELVAHKRRAPTADLLSSLVAAEEGGDRLTNEEIWMLATLLFGAGFETTAHQIGNGLYGLLQHPAELERLRRDPALLRLLPDELLRYDGTAQMTVRVTTVPTEVGGVQIPADQTVLVLLAAGNRDPLRYPEPDRIDLSRANVRPLSFGGGVHYCIGAALSRVELELVFAGFLQRCSHLELAAVPRHRDRIVLRGLEALEVRCRS
jgi:cytochrome P450